MKLFDLKWLFILNFTSFFIKKSKDQSIYFWVEQNILFSLKLITSSILHFSEKNSFWVDAKPFIFSPFFSSANWTKPSGIPTARFGTATGVLTEHDFLACNNSPSREAVMLLKDSHTQCLPSLGEGDVADRCAIGKLFSKRMQPAREYSLKMFLLEKSESSFWPWLTWRWDHSDVSARSEAVEFAGWLFDSGGRGRKKCTVHCFQWPAYVWLGSTLL